MGMEKVIPRFAICRVFEIVVCGATGQTLLVHTTIMTQTRGRNRMARRNFISSSSITAAPDDRDACRSIAASAATEGCIPDPSAVFLLRFTISVTQNPHLPHAVHVGSTGTACPVKMNIPRTADRPVGIAAPHKHGRLENLAYHVRKMC